MTVTFVDDEQLLVDFLRRHAAIAAVIGNRIGTKLPPVLDLPRIRLVRLGGVSPAPQRLDHPRVQIECYGAGDGEAKDLAFAVRAALPSIVGAHALGVVTSVDEISGPQWLPDPTAGPGATPTPRYLFSVQLTTHPN